MNIEFFGWSARAWARPFRKAVDGLAPPTVLEIGASDISAISLNFMDMSDLITVSSYPETLSVKTKRKWNLIYPDRSNIEFRSMSVHKVHGKYDLIVMKSVLGGVCRNSKVDCHMEIIKNLVFSNLNDGGSLITLDNGSSIMERVLGGVGARANNWRFYKAIDFIDYTDQFVFGLISAFSFQSRMGSFGKIFETAMYCFDRVFELTCKGFFPTVIVTVYHKTTNHYKTSSV